MNDKDLLSAVREDFSGVRMHTEAGAILAGGAALRRRRNHRRIYAATGACAIAAAAAVSGVALASPETGGTHDAQLTAWTVQKEANGTIDVTIHDLINLGALQQELNADGVPAEVVSDPDYPAACVDREAMKDDMAAVITLGPKVPIGYVFVIHPAGIPSGTRLLLDVIRPTTVTSGGRVASTGDVGGRLWAFGAGTAPGVTGKKYVSVAAGMGLVHDTGSC
jgi:hypothetical protein